MLKTAAQYYSAGFHVLPIWLGKKNPKVDKWDPSKRFDLNEINHFFNDESSIAIVCGEVSGGVEILDFDNKFGDSDAIISEFMGIDGVAELTERLPIERSPSGGFHILYKCTPSIDKMKLAKRYDSEQKKAITLIEVQANGSYCVVYPSLNYTMIQGDINEIPFITIDERNILITAALALNEYHIEQQAPALKVGGEKLPSEFYNNSLVAEGEALQLLLESGWKQSRNPVYLIRPNKDIKDGISATFSSPKTGRGILNVFSSNAAPFDSGHGYTPFQIMALLKFNGDFSACAKHLRERGFYEKKEITKEQKNVILTEVKKNLKEGRYLSPTEQNQLAEKLDLRVDLIVPYVKKCQSHLKDLEDYEDWTTIKKIEYFLTRNYKFRIDIVCRIAEMKTKSTTWDTLNKHTIYRQLQHDEPKLKFSLDNIKSLLKSDFVERYDPILNYFNNCAAWDGIDNIKELCKYLVVDDAEYFEIMLKKAMVRNIKCAIEPDYYNRIVLVFSSELEEIGKSKFFMWLNPFGAKFYSDEVLRDNKDSRLALSENFIYNLEELDGLSKYGSAKLKATISTRGVTDRLPYAANKEYFPRRCTFWGSTNQTEFLLNDKNTRWLPFKIHKIDWQSYIKAINPADLWRQAWQYYKDPEFDCELTDDEKRHRNKRNENYRVEDVEESILIRHFQIDPLAFMTNAEILATIQLKANGLKVTWTPVIMGKTLSRLGYERKRQNNSRGWGIRELQINEEIFIDNLPF